jgi:hypothetical protein
VEIINEQDPTYSPLSLYFIIDNKLISNQSEINSYFDILIEKVSLDKEIKNLVIYKKALFNADQAQESDLLNILNPLINSTSVWKSHALYLMAEYFYSKDQKQKSKEFFNQIMTLENPNTDIKTQAQKRLNRDLSDDSQKVLWKKNYYLKSEKKLNPQLDFLLSGENLLVADNIAKYYSLNVNSGEVKLVKK